MDFNKIKDAVEAIELSSSERENIINSCKDKKRKFNFKPVAGIAAAAAVIVVILVSPGFLFKASSPNESADMLMDNASSDFDLYYTADDAAGVPQQYECNSSATATSDVLLFEADGFAEIYSVVPYEFSSLVNTEEYQSWSSFVSAKDGMAIMQFVKHFDIEKDVFDTANSEYSKRSSYEIGFDSDIIYTFDREIVDSFYKK